MNFLQSPWLLRASLPRPPLAFSPMKRYSVVTLLKLRKKRFLPPSTRLYCFSLQVFAFLLPPTLLPALPIDSRARDPPPYRLRALIPVQFNQSPPPPTVRPSVLLVSPSARAPRLFFYLRRSLRRSYPVVTSSDNQKFE